MRQGPYLHPGYMPVNPMNRSFTTDPPPGLLPRTNSLPSDSSNSKPSHPQNFHKMHDVVENIEEEEKGDKEARNILSHSTIIDSGWSNPHLEV